MKTLQKNEDTWCGVLWHYDAEYDSILRIFEGWWYGWRSIHNRNSDDNLHVRYLYWNDDRWDWNNNWLDNDWNDNNPAALRATLFISHPRLTARVCFVSSTVRSTRRASFRPLRAGEKVRHISSYQSIWSPRGRGAGLSACRVCEWRVAPTAVSPSWRETSPRRLLQLLQYTKYLSYCQAYDDALSELSDSIRTTAHMNSSISQEQAGVSSGGGLFMESFIRGYHLSRKSARSMERIQKREAQSN